MIHLVFEETFGDSNFDFHHLTMLRRENIAEPGQGYDIRTEELQNCVGTFLVGPPTPPLGRDCPADCPAQPPVSAAWPPPESGPSVCHSSGTASSSQPGGTSVEDRQSGSRGRECWRNGCPPRSPRCTWDSHCYPGGSII